MVDQYGNWTEEDYNTYPKEKWCDIDYIANWVRQRQYNPVVSMERLCLNMYESYGQFLDNNAEPYYAAIDPRPYPDCLMIFMPDFVMYIQENGGFQEYDYEV